MAMIRKITGVLTGLIMIAFGFLMSVGANEIYKILILILGISMLIAGVRSIIYYISMARHMVGGIGVLYRGVIIFDIGLFTLSLADVPLIFVVLYLAGLHGFYGFIDIMRAIEGKQMQASWKLRLSHGIINIIIALICLIFMRTAWISVMMYGLGLMYSGLIRIIQTFRRTAVVYIQ